MRKNQRPEPAGGDESPLLQSFKPISDGNSRILILGTMPSPASIRAGMYYSHPQNAFWRLLSELTGDESGAGREERCAFLLRNRIAVWDTLRCCVREGAADSRIRKPVYNDISGLLDGCPEIRAVFLNGGAAFRYYRKCGAAERFPGILLPSTSPANARGGYLGKLERWRVILPFLK
ncbi:MAG TPA: DNA-deoxyinosine glycosylase [Clostridia bacterium]|nr:DNA-deoxyinosine glycosylase [Clostridia bacterium]